MIFKKDSALLGLLLGLFIPMLCFILQQKIIPIIIGHAFSLQSMQLFALVLNVPVFRYYLINLQYEKTAKGMLFITFIYALIWVYINRGVI